VGMDGIVLARDAAAGTWTRISTAPDLRLNDIVALDADHLVIVGDGDAVLTSDDGGRTFQRRAIHARSGLITVWGIGATALAAGHDGVILRSDDYGVTWRALAPLSYDAGI